MVPGARCSRVTAGSDWPGVSIQRLGETALSLSCSEWCQAPGVTGSLQGLIGQVSVFRGWGRQHCPAQNGARCYRVTARTGWPGVSIQRLGETALSCTEWCQVLQGHCKNWLARCQYSEAGGDSTVLHRMVPGVTGSLQELVGQVSVFRGWGRQHCPAQNGARCYRVTARTGWPGVSILKLGETALSCTEWCQVLQGHCKNWLARCQYSEAGGDSTVLLRMVPGVTGSLQELVGQVSVFRGWGRQHCPAQNGARCYRVTARTSWPGVSIQRLGETALSCTEWCQVLQGHCKNWLARCQYTEAGWDSKFNQKLLFHCCSR